MTDSPSPSPSELETVIEVPVNQPAQSTEGFQLTATNGLGLVAVAVGAWMLGKLAQIWLKDYLKRKRGGGSNES